MLDWTKRETLNFKFGFLNGMKMSKRKLPGYASKKTRSQEFKDNVLNIFATTKTPPVSQSTENSQSQSDLSSSPQVSEKMATVDSDSSVSTKYLVILKIWSLCDQSEIIYSHSNTFRTTSLIQLTAICPPSHQCAIKD